MPDLDTVSWAERLNRDCQAATLDRTALQSAMQAQGSEWRNLAMERCPHLFAAAPVFVAAAHMRQMRDVIAAVERVVALPGWIESIGLAHPWLIPCMVRDEPSGVFYGYDFHLNSDGAHLIEINSNAGGGFLTALLLESQRENSWPGVVVAQENSGQVFIEMFLNEWRLSRGSAALRSIAIVDEKPQEQYLYPEFLLAQRMFERAGIAAYIADPTALKAHDGLFLEYNGGICRIDMVYNRLTDFSLRRHPPLLRAYLDGSTVVTPNPAHYYRYADKRNLARLSDAVALRALGVDETDIATLHDCLPETSLVEGTDHVLWWHERKLWFFKPATGFGSKGSYSGAKLTKRVFEEIMQGGYVAQRSAAPGERLISVERMEAQPFKYDVRCYVYNGQVQLVAARLYQGQTTNFRTDGGGFAPVCLVG